jgi:glycosyltransferase involved in cell wall biosynthesis
MRRRVDVVLNSLAIGGAERHSVMLANALAAAAFDIRLVALSAADSLLSHASPSVAQRAVLLPRRGPFDHHALGSYRRRLSEDRPDLIVTVNQYPLAFVAAACTLGRRPPLMQIMHTIELPHEDRWLERQLHRRLLGLPRAIVYVCELQRSHWRAQGIGARPDHCIHSGVDLEHFRPPLEARRAAERAALGLSPEAFVVGLCSVLRPEKRHDLLLRAVAGARRDGWPLHALLIGDGPERGAIEALARDLGVADAITITGYRRDVAAPIAAADCMCLVSDYEAFSLSILESMAMAKAVVATRAGAVAEQIDDGVDGLLLPRGDAGALLAALERLREPPLRAAIGERARATVERRFDARTMHQRFARLVGELCDPTTTMPAAARTAP